MKKYEFYKNEVVNSIVELVTRSEHLYGNSVAFRYKKNKRIAEKTYTEVLNDSKSMAEYLLSHNFKVGHIAILGASSYEWIITYLGAMFAGLVVVPLDKELAAEELIKLINIADVDCLLYDAQYSDIAQSLAHDNGFRGLSSEFNDAKLNGKKSVDLPITEPDKLSSILFTSGTTGQSKGVMLTQRNIARNVIQGVGAVDLKHTEDVIMSVLPLHHAYEFTCTILGMLYKGVPICIGSGLKYIQKDFADYKPTVMFVVPLIAEKFYEKIQLAVKRQSKEKKFTFAIVLSNILRKVGIDITDKMFKEIKISFGGRLKTIMCGGSPLSEDLIKKFYSIGINLFQGYGLTECSPLLTVNFDYYHRPGSVGKIVQDNYVKVVDGEIWAKGVSVCTGYYNNLEETVKSFEDGWFKTGDLGKIDNDGFVFLIGRKKNLIILSNGENVSAEELEGLVCTIPAVSETIVYGENERIIAEIYLNPDIEATEHEVKSQIDLINKKLPLYKRIDNVKFRETPFEKTTSQKIKRNR